MSYERNDASLPVVAVGAGTLIFLLVASIVVSAYHYRAHFGSTRGFPRDDRQTSFTLGPESESDSLRSWQDAQAEARQLDSYGWIDRKAGMARIPIERAMRLMAAGARPAVFPPASAAVKEAEAIQNRTPMPNIK